MDLFYTVTSGYNAEQPNPSRSLGGFKSSTPLANDDFGNLFDDISVMTIKSGRNEYRAIILKNTTDSVVNNVKVFVQRPDHAICNFLLSKGDMISTNKYNQKSMESISSPNFKPFRSKFQEATEDEPLMIGSLNPGEEVGIWITRSVDKIKAKAQYEKVCEKDDTDPNGRRYKAITPEKEESIDIQILWD